jgi:hypothetical protein
VKRVGESRREKGAEDAEETLAKQDKREEEGKALLQDQPRSSKSLSLSSQFLSFLFFRRQKRRKGKE